MLGFDPTGLDNLFRDAPFAVVVYEGPRFRTTFSNAKHELITNYRLILGKPLLESIPELADQPAYKTLQEVYKTGVTQRFQEMVVDFIVKGQPARSYYDLTYQAIENPATGEKGVLLSAVDITEHVETRQKLQETLRKRDEFLSMASHELKTPLTTLSLQTQLIQLAFDRGEAKYLAADILKAFNDQNARQIQRLSRLIDDMLDVSRIQRGKLAYHIEKTELSAALREVVNRLKPQLEAEGSSINVESPPHMEGDWDIFRIEQVITNLLLNATRYGAGKPIQVSLRQAGDNAILTIADQGIGIAKENQERIFERFERAAAINQPSGLGLGLFIAREIVSNHGGRITVESELGKGSTFTVQLPLHPNRISV